MIARLLVLLLLCSQAIAGVHDGQPINAAVTNAAFLNKNQDDTDTFKITLSNSDPVSGTGITNLQRELSAICSYVGCIANQTKTYLPSWATTNRGLSNDSVFTRVEAIDTAFNGSTGHTHDGSTGNGPQISLATGISGTLGIAHGGTGQVTASAAFDALSPLTTLGDLIYFSTTNTRLAGNTAATRKFLRQTGTGAVSAAPTWDTLLDADIPLTNTHILVGNGSGVAADVACSGDVTCANTGAITIANSAVTNAKLADMAQSTIKGRAVSAGTGAPIDLTATQATAILNTFSSTLQGLVPASGGGTTNFLRADGSFAAPATGGDFSGPASSHDNAAIVFNGTTGKLGKEATFTQHNVLTAGANNIFSSVAPGTSGNVLTSDGTDWTSAAATGASSSSSSDIYNVGLASSISSNTLIVALKQSDGSTDCSSGTSACKIGVRNSTATSGAYAQDSITAAMSITLSSTDSIGWVLAVQPLYIYYISDTTSEICLSATLFDDGAVKTASALTGGADTAGGTLWCTSAHTSKPIRYLGNVAATWSNPNWGSITALRMQPNQAYISDKVYAVYNGNAGTSITGNTTNIDFSTKVVDSHNAFSGSLFTAPRAGFYVFQGGIKLTASVGGSADLYINGTQKAFSAYELSNTPLFYFSYGWFMNSGDTASIRCSANGTLSNSATQHFIMIHSQ